MKENNRNILVYFIRIMSCIGRRINYEAPLSFAITFTYGNTSHVIEIFKIDFWIDGWEGEIYSCTLLPEVPLPRIRPMLLKWRTHLWLFCDSDGHRKVRLPGLTPTKKWESVSCDPVSSDVVARGHPTPRLRMTETSKRLTFRLSSSLIVDSTRWTSNSALKFP